MKAFLIFALLFSISALASNSRYMLLASQSYSADEFNDIEPSLKFQKYSPSYGPQITLMTVIKYRDLIEQKPVYEYYQEGPSSYSVGDEGPMIKPIQVDMHD